MRKINDVEDNKNNFDCTRTDLDKQERIAVLLKNYHVTNHTGRTEEVKPFSLERKSLHEMPIVDAVTQRDDPHTGGPTCWY